MIKEYIQPKEAEHKFIDDFIIGHRIRMMENIYTSNVNQVHQTAILEQDTVYLVTGKQYDCLRIALPAIRSIAAPREVSPSLVPPTEYWIKEQSFQHISKLQANDNKPAAKNNTAFHDIVPGDHLLIRQNLQVKIAIMATKNKQTLLAQGTLYSIRAKRYGCLIIEDMTTAEKYWIMKNHHFAKIEQVPPLNIIPLPKMSSDYSIYHHSDLLSISTGSKCNSISHDHSILLRKRQAAKKRHEKNHEHEWILNKVCISKIAFV